MARDPELFVRLVELAFRPADASPDERHPLTPAQQQTALSAFEVLNDWPASQFVPGLDDDGKVDGDSLNTWIDTARERLAAINRSDIGDEVIGTALAAAPADPDGGWPGIAVRDLLDHLQLDNVDHGFQIAVSNRRGVTSRSPTAGGDQERQLTEDYIEQSRLFKAWPRTAAILKNLARTYEHEAGVHDREAEFRRRGL